MGINRGVKQLVVRPTEDNMHRLTCTMQYRSLIQHAIKELVSYTNVPSSHLPDKASIKASYLTKVDKNIITMMDSLHQCQIFTAVATNRGLHNYFLNKKATPEQERDLLALHTIGQTAYQDYVKYRILKTNITQRPQRRRQLNTFSTTKREHKQTKQIEKEKKNLKKCLRRKLQWVGAQGKQENLSISEQLTVVPYAITKDDNIPLKGPKHKTTDFLK